jgi:RNA polymerase sigma-70 factor (ECF subfamily)
MQSLSDISLVAQVAVFHNQRAFDQLVRKYQSPVRRFLLNLTLGNEALSDDLAQDTFLKAYTHITQFKGIASFQTWLFRIAYNIYYDHKRKTHPQPLSEREGNGKTQSDELSTPLTYREGSGVGIQMDIHAALAILKEEERVCVTLQLIDGYSLDEISKMTNMPVNTVKSHLRRGKEKLTTYLKNNGYDGNR